MTIASRLGRFLRRATASSPVPSAPLPPPERWDEQLHAAGHTRDQWLAARRDRGRLYADVSADCVRALAAQFPDRVRRTQAAADRILRHEFDLLGSGPYTPVDAGRSIGPDGYLPIDWTLDPVSSLRFPAGFRHTEWTPAMRPGLADIKLPWELGRCQHWVALGQAFRLSGDEAYAREIVRQHEDFLEANPIGVGVQYVCTMDVAIRAFNWALAFELIRQSPVLDEHASERAYQSLFDHGTFIERNLENKYEVTSNHFLSNVVGLFGLGVVFADLPAGARWLTQGRAWLEQEMQVQVLGDGADYESSVPYHRLVLELFLSGARLAQLTDAPLSSGYFDRLRRMVEFLAAMIRPDGLLPQVGDADDGRVHIFTDYGSWNPQDGRHVFGPASQLIGGDRGPDSGGEAAVWEAAWWGFDVAGTAQPASAREESVHLFREAGIAVARRGDSYLLITNGRVGTNGFGNHKHNDLLGFEFHDAGTALFVDPGSYVYTSNPDARNLFRSTAAHNTLRVDAVEQNDLKADYLFRLFETSTVEHLDFEDTADALQYRGRHTGYERLVPPVSHERTFRLDKTSDALLIVDRLLGSGRHRIDWHFHLAPGVDVERARERDFVLSAAGRTWHIRVPAGLTGVVAAGWYSPSYGVRVSCRAIDLTQTVDLAGIHEFSFLIGTQEAVSGCP